MRSAIGCTSNEARAALTAVQHRLQGYARVHQLLQMSEYTTAIDLTVYLSQLCRSCSKLEGRTRPGDGEFRV
jgi:two-component sensor histidine kinase